MNMRTLAIVAVVSAGLFVTSPVSLAAAKAYQVTGPILAIEGKTVTIQKNDEKWEIDLTDDTKVEGKLKVGEKVTIYYHMVASKVEPKE
jgi:hypothetical protein